MAAVEENSVKSKMTKKYFGIAKTNTVYVTKDGYDPKILDLAKSVYEFTKEDIRWGHVDARTKQLSFAILMDLLENPSEAFEVNSLFCNSIISLLKDKEDWIITEFQIRQFIRSMELREMAIRQANGLKAKLSKEEKEEKKEKEKENSNSDETVIVTGEYNMSTEIIYSKAEVEKISRPEKKRTVNKKKDNDMTQFNADDLIAMGRAFRDKENKENKINK